MILDDYDVLIFDLDGLIIDSLENLSTALTNSIKDFAEELEIARFKDYDKKNPGLSRFEKVDYFCSEIAKNRFIDKKEILTMFDHKSLSARVQSAISPSFFKLYDKKLS